MAIDNDMALAEIDAFISQNSGNLARIRVDNPNLYDVVSNTLSFLSKKFGGEELPPIVVSQPEKVVEIEQVPVAEEKEEEPRQFRIGDVFYHKDNKDRKFRILSVDSDEIVEVSILGINSVTLFELDDVNYFIKFGIWVKDKFQNEIESKLASKITPYSPQNQSAQPIIPQSAPISSTQINDQERINEIKDAIQGLKVLADFGDEEAIEEIKNLKKELKTLKPAKK